MADQWEEAAKGFKSDPGKQASPGASTTNDDWKIWRKAGDSDGPDGPVSNAISHATSRISEIPGAIGSMVAHPIDTVTGMYRQGKQLAGEGVDAAKAGDYPLAAARGIETLMPGVGPAIANGFKTIKSGDTSGGVGDMMGTVGPALALRGAAMSPKVQAFTRGAFEAAKEPTSAHLGPFRLSVAVPAPISGGVAGSMIGGHFGMPGVGTAIGTVAPLIRGGMRAAEGEDWLPSAPTRIPNPAMPPSQRLLNRGGFVMPPSDAPDPSFVRGVPAMAYPPNPARAITAGAKVHEMPGVADPSFVRGVPAELPMFQNAPTYTGSARLPKPAFDPPMLRETAPLVAEESHVIPTPLTPPKTAAAAASATGSAPDYSDITSQYKVSKSRARFDASGKRIGG